MEALIISILTAFGWFQIPESALRHMDLQALLKDLQNNNIEEVKIPLPQEAIDGMLKRPDTSFDWNGCRQCK